MNVRPADPVILIQLLILDDEYNAIVSDHGCLVEEVAVVARY